MSNHMNDDDKLNALKQTAIPAPSEAARRRALDAAMLAFDAEQTSQKRAAQGNPITQRLRSIFANAKGTWTMDNRLSYGLGTAAVALLLLPLGYQLYTSTAITPIGVPPVVKVSTDADKPVVQPEPAPMEIGRADELKKEAAGNAAATTTTTAEAPAAHWWEGLNDPTLNALITKAITANPNAQVAQALIQIAPLGFDFLKLFLLRFGFGSLEA